MAEKKAPAEKKDQKYINFYHAPVEMKDENGAVVTDDNGKPKMVAGKGTLHGPFTNPKGTEYFTSDFKDNQRVMVPASIVKARSNGTGYFIQGDDDFMNSHTLNISAKNPETGKFEANGTVTLAEYGAYRDDANKAAAKRKLEQNKKAAEAAAPEADAAEADGPEVG